jgi:hypothetical protein
MSTPDARRPYVVGAVKIPYADRDVAHQVITAADDRDFFNVIGADDDPKVGHTLPTGRNVTYRVELTDDEADLFRSASNCRYVELDGVDEAHAAAISTPAASSMRFMRADFARIDQFHGRDVTVAIIDGGVSPAVREALGATLVARQVTAADPPNADGITVAHGCKVAACLIPPGGRYIDAVTTDLDGANTISTAAAAARWCTDQGAKVINYSAGGANPASAWEDSVVYMRDRGVQFFASAGNDNVNSLSYPSAYSTTYANVHSSIAFDENTGAKSTFSSYSSTASGCTPGTDVLGFAPDARPLLWNGTSASSPHMAQLCVRGATGGRFTAAQVGAALKANTRDTGQPAAQQGGGAYSLEAALTALGAFNNLPAPPFRRNLSPNPSLETNTSGYAVAVTRPGVTAPGVTRSSTIPTPFGANYLSTNVTGDGTTSNNHDVQISLPSVAVTAGKPYVFSVHSRIASGAGLNGPSIQWAVLWVNSAGAAVGQSTGVNWSLMDTVWARYHHVAIPPTGAVEARLWLYTYGFSSTSPVSWRLDGFHYEQAAALGPYFDGSTTGAAWEAAANNSTSTVGTAAVTGTDYHPIAAIMPTSDLVEEGAYRFLANNLPGDTRAAGLLDYPRPAGAALSQVNPTKPGIDQSEWHNYALEWGPDGVTGYLDGQQWFQYAGGAVTGSRKDIQAMPKGHLALQLDAFTGSGLTPATMEVDWVRVYSLTPQTGGGGGTPSPVAGTLAERLRLGFGDGLTKVNLGMDFLSGQGPSGKQGTHVDFTLSQLTTSGGFTWPGYADLRDDGAVRLTAYVGAATTPNSTHSRTEFRALASNGVDKEAFSVSSSSRHYVWVKGAIIRAPAGRRRICLAQCHAPTDDLCMIMYEDGTVFSTFGDTGRPGTLATGVTLGSIHQYMIELTGGQIRFYWDNMASPGATQSYTSGSGLYFKFGNYQQSSTATDPVGEMAVVDLYDAEIWHSGMPEPAARH